jgi:hypothetical protein
MCDHSQATRASPPTIPTAAVVGRGVTRDGTRCEWVHPWALERTTVAERECRSGRGYLALSRLCISPSPSLSLHFSLHFSFSSLTLADTHTHTHTHTRTWHYVSDQACCADAPGDICTAKVVRAALMEVDRDELSEFKNLVHLDVSENFLKLSMFSDLHQLEVSSSLRITLLSMEKGGGDDHRRRRRRVVRR